ncbi:MAG: serine/threonine-protein kinase, partial [Gemmatimonadota bacterium]
MTAPIKGIISCSRCGSEVASGVHFCAICGNDVSGVQAALPTQQMATPTGMIRGAEAMQQELIEHLRHATLGEYEILGELGRGGMATVYLAHEIALDRKVAIKVMSPALVQGDGMIERFKREARTAASLSHPNIIPVYAVRETDRLLYFVMKFVQGRPLDSIIKEVGPLPIPMVKAILAQAGSAFGYAHRRGIVHRDIKPANIMIDDEGWAVVTDFGIAKVSETQGLTMTGMTVGTPTYMSPEQCMAQDVTGASDQYSLGVVGYEMITGRPPFTGGSMMTIMYGHFNEIPPAIPPLRPDCPQDLQMSIMRMLEKDATKRWPSVDDAVVAVGAQSLSHDDPTRTQLVSLAKDGAARTQALLGKMSVPLSPIPGTRSKPGVPAQTASGAKTAIATPAIRGPRTQPVSSPTRSGGKGLLIGGAIALALAAGVLGMLKPWQKPAAEPSQTAIPVEAPGTTPVDAGTATTPATTTGAAASLPAAADPAPTVTPPPAATDEAAGRNTESPRQLARDRALYLDMRRTIESARRQALGAGATSIDMSAGEIELASAETLARARRF